MASDWTPPPASPQTPQPTPSPAADVPPSSAPPSAQPVGDGGSAYLPPYPAYPPYQPSPPQSYVPSAPYAPYPNPNPQPYPPQYPYPAPYFPWVYAQPPRLGTWALVSMICGTVSIVTLQPIVAALAVVFGFVGLNEIKKSSGQVEGRGFAIAGVVTGFASIGIWLALIAMYIIYIIAFFSAFQPVPG